MLQLNLHQTLGQLKLAVKLDIPNKGVTAIFGRSGAGKSSLINLIAGLSTPQKGYIRLNQQTLFDSEQRINLAPEKRKIGYVFQEHRLFPHYTVEKNLKYGYKRSDSAHFLQIVQLLGIEHLLTRFPASLSGGEKQRVAIGRALLSEPQLLLMDEPLSALDLPRKQELMNYLSKLAAQIEIPILYVSHSLDEIIRLADNLILLEQGKVTLFDSVANVWHHPAFTAWQPDSQKIWINETPHYHIGDKLRLTIASKDVSISLKEPNPSSIRNILTGKITEIIPHSDRMDIAVLVDSHIIWASISLWSFDELALKNGQNVYLQIKSVSL
ncbi:molybdate transporter ATP-binding protein [Actinobacillus lignieresii]|uniref:molybdenum ABC transporter ATP-binding protein n=1 Tax=Actinobacillus lignieresii TaxID=720 RepID=UPI000F6BD221|nr:molybdenum ABC transporter ATP-binding protein [Actinobacillus lignieresii]VEB26544.1 molybdate transporter ATP-binding protein [Actinobacillus lignieresii]